MKRFLMMCICLTIFVLSCAGAAKAEWIYATDGQVHIHTDADVNSHSVGIFYRGQKAWVYDHTYTSDGRNWCRIYFDNDWAYVSDRHSSYEVDDPYEYEDINEYQDEPHDEEELYEEECGFDYYHGFEYESAFEFEVTRQTQVRGWADSTADVIGRIGVGYIVEGSILYVSPDDNKVWLEVQWDNEQFGYICTDALKLCESLIDGTYPRLSRKMKVNTHSVNVRQDADIDSKSVGILNEGDVVLIDFFVCVEDGERRIWADCVDERGQVLGFISTRYLIPVR